MSFVYRLTGGQGWQEHMERLHNEGERKGGREAADKGKQPTCSRREACVGFNNSAGFTFQPAGGAASRSKSPLGEDGQNVASNSRPSVWACDHGGREGWCDGGR